MSRFLQNEISIRHAALASIFLATMVSAVDSHSLGEGPNDLTPPLKFYARQLLEMRGQFGTGSSALRGVFSEMNLWSGGSTLQVCFYDGEPR